jgi:hypothetical protein
MSRIDLDSGKWFDMLDVISTNLVTEANSREVLEIETFRNRLTPQINELRYLGNSFAYLDLTIEKDLRNWESLLRMIRKRSGLQQSFKDDKKRIH